MSKFISALLTTVPLGDRVVEEITRTYGPRFSPELEFDLAEKAPLLGFDPNSGLLLAAMHYQLKNALEFTSLHVSNLESWDYDTTFNLSMISFSLKDQLGNGSSDLSLRSWILFLGLCENDPDVSVQSVIDTALRLAKCEIPSETRP